MDAKQLQDLIAGIFRGEASQDEYEKLRAWFDSHRSDAELKAIWDNTPSDIDPELKADMWNMLHAAVGAEREESPAVVAVKWWRKPLNIAAAVVVLLSCCTALAYYIGGDRFITANSVPYVVEVQRGQKASMRLADGTVVWLNSGSSVSYDGSYNSRDRVVHLNGEAYFEVAKNPNKKFIVKCNGLQVEALGTKFDVKAYADDGTITTTLAQGKVRVSSSDESVILAPKDVARYDTKKHSISKSTVDDLAIADYWRSNSLVFNSETLSSISRTVERMYGVNIIIKDPSIRNVRFSGTIRNNSLQNIFQVISLTYPIRYSIKDSTVTISRE